MDDQKNVVAWGNFYSLQNWQLGDNYAFWKQLKPDPPGNEKVIPQNVKSKSKKIVYFFAHFFL